MVFIVKNNFQIFFTFSKELQSHLLFFKPWGHLANFSFGFMLAIVIHKFETGPA